MNLKKAYPKQITFLFALLAGIRVNLIGVMPLSEVLSIFLFPTIKQNVKLFQKIPDLRKICFAYIFFLIFQIISDVFNGSDFSNYIRGWANILVAIVVLVFTVHVFYRSPSLIKFFLLGQILKILFFSSTDLEDMNVENLGFLKFKLVPALNNLLLILSIWYLNKYPNKKINIIITFISYGLFCLLNDARSNGLFFILTSMIFYFQNIIIKGNFFKISFFIIGFAVVFQVSYSYYVSKVLSGDLGGNHAYSQLSRLENPYNPVNLLKSGRTETYIAIIAASRRPFLGYGSWAKDPGGEFRRMGAELKGKDELKKYMALESGRSLIPSHSVLFGAWIYAGVGGFLSMLYIMILSLKRSFFLIKNKTKDSDPYNLLVILYALMIAWTFLFSPLSHIRQTLPFFIAIIIVLNNKVKQNLI